MVEPVPLRARHRRTWGQRALLSVNVVLVVVLLASSAAVAWGTRRIGQLERLDIDQALTAAPDEGVVTAADVAPVSLPDGEAAADVAAPPSTIELPPPGDAENYLIIGSDNASTLDPDSDVLSGRDDNESVFLADTIMVLRLDPSAASAYLLSIPRDLEVPIAGTRRVGLINSAYNHPDPDVRAQRITDTVEEFFDIGIQHYVEIDLAGFTRLVDEVGGVPVCFEQPARDDRVGLLVETAGVHVLDGETALKFVRSRSGYRVQETDGRWVRVGGNSDLERIERQQEFLSAVVDESFTGVVTDPARLRRILDIVVDTVGISNTLSVLDDGPNLAGWFRDFGTDRFVTESLAVFNLANENLAPTRDAEVQVDRLRGIEPDDVVAKRVEVRIVSAGSAARQAVRDGLRDVGFVASGGGSSARDDDAVVVRYGPGGEAAATLVAAYLDAVVTWEPDTDLAADSVVLDLGTGLPGVLDVPHTVADPPPPVVVTTTAPTSPTTAPGTTGPSTTATPTTTESSSPCA